MNTRTNYVAISEEQGRTLALGSDPVTELKQYHGVNSYQKTASGLFIAGQHYTLYKVSQVGL